MADVSRFLPLMGGGGIQSPAQPPAAPPGALHPPEPWLPPPATVTPKLGDGGGGDPNLSEEEEIAAHDTLMEWLQRVGGKSPAQAGDTDMLTIENMINDLDPDNEAVRDALDKTWGAATGVPRAPRKPKAQELPAPIETDPDKIPMY